MAFIITWKWYGSRSSLIIGSQFWLTVRGPRSQVTMGFSVSGLVRHKSDVNEGRSIWIRALPGIVILGDNSLSNSLPMAASSVLLG
ncbi:uncharacterized protein BO96DRAFT_351351 [Aspergillus niger CBS 101883]|uniref:Contig An04c0220, genomic contig n=2 Tax=Aspergillus niger TaxID=5061 RepID=A2QJM1_ASPNC|nr:uncharacterized protein BO96DRAFT_351351 [Aspergillus niger CBS 101883]XP_059600637.1 uncharacterized protein An04g07550 [Aspergillus niger]PYH50960.1 hypothetical protein BO96DRAFT_351351 [Aspergillus niger CBS 101883]CAK38911.1 unnamed protein product [Aspergillus niger]